MSGVNFVERSREALADEALQAALRKTTDRLYSGRLTAMATLATQAEGDMALGTLDDLRQEARAIKEHTINHLDYYLKQAADAIRAAGGQVHFAQNAGEAVEIAARLCRERGARTAVKSKSMATEEVHLNQGLAAVGVEVVESDLGEYIIQLAGETPSHLVVPAIHKNRHQVAELFGAVAGQAVATDTPSLTAFARAQLREKFLTADVGFTGANFLVAESGTLCLVTNEGNGRLTTSVPKVQISVVGIEKLVPSLDDLAVMLALLPRSATGQKITSYVNLITGPRQEGEPDGPEELHVIFLDNGRSGLLGTEFAEALYCIRCGACLNACPVYRNAGGHSYGGVYSGPIGAVITPLLSGFDGWQDLPQASSLCGSCWEVCPVGIHLHDHLVRLRERVISAGRGSWGERIIFRLWVALWRRPWGYQLSGRLARWAMRPFAKRNHQGREVTNWLPQPLTNWTRTRSFPVVAAQSFRDRWAALAEEGDE